MPFSIGDRVEVVEKIVEAPVIDTEKGMVMMAEKLDTAEKVAKMLGCFGSTTAVTDDTFAEVRDVKRVSRGYFKTVALYAIKGITSVSQDKHAHVAKCGTLISYAQSDEKRRADVWTTTKLGRFLTKYHPELDNETVKKAVAEFNYKYGPAPTVKFGETEADFIHAIADGPSDSCMAHAFHNEGVFRFKGHIHPAAVYAAGEPMAFVYVTDEA